METKSRTSSLQNSCHPLTATWTPPLISSKISSRMSHHVHVRLQGLTLPSRVFPIAPSTLPAPLVQEAVKMQRYINTPMRSQLVATIHLAHDMWTAVPCAQRLSRIRLQPIWMT